MADGAPLSVGSREAADADPAPQDVRHAAPAHVLVLLHTDITPLPGAASARVTSGPRPPAGDKHLDCGKASSGREIRQGGGAHWEGFSRLKGKALRKFSQKNRIFPREKETGREAGLTPGLAWPIIHNK